MDVRRLRSQSHCVYHPAFLSLSTTMETRSLSPYSSLPPSRIQTWSLQLQTSSSAVGFTREMGLPSADARFVLPFPIQELSYPDTTAGKLLMRLGEAFNLILDETEADEPYLCRTGRALFLLDVW